MHQSPTLFIPHCYTRSRCHHQTSHLCPLGPFGVLETNKRQIEFNSLSTPSGIATDQDNGCWEIYSLSFSLWVSWIIKMPEMGLSRLNFTDWWHKTGFVCPFLWWGMGLMNCASVNSASIALFLRCVKCWNPGLRFTEAIWLSYSN